MEEVTPTSQHSSDSSRLVATASKFVLLSIILAISFIAIAFKAPVWIVLYAAWLGLSISTLLLLKKKHPFGRSCAIWAPWFALALSMPIFHRALYLVPHYALERHPGSPEMMAFFFCIGYAIIMLPASILLLRPAAKAAFLQSGYATPTQQIRGRLPWPVWTAAAFYCLPFLFALYGLLDETANHLSTGDQGPFIDLLALGLLAVAINLVRRSRVARAFALWLPLCLFLLAFVIARGEKYIDPNVAIYGMSYEVMMISGFLVLAAFALVPAVILLILPSAKKAFRPVTALPPESLPDTAPSPGAETNVAE